QRERERLLHQAVHAQPPFGNLDLRQIEMIAQVEAPDRRDAGGEGGAHRFVVERPLGEPEQLVLSLGPRQRRSSQPPGRRCGARQRGLEEPPAVEGHGRTPCCFLPRYTDREASLKRAAGCPVCRTGILNAGEMQLTVKEAARLLNVPEPQIYNWIDGGEIPYSRAHGRIRFNEAELLEWATARGLRASHRLQGESAEQGPALADALALGGVHEGVAAADRDAAIRAAVERLPLGPGADRETLVEVMLAREAAGSTAVGDGIAIPHVRAPIVQNGVQPAIALCTLAQPVDF